MKSVVRFRRGGVEAVLGRQLAVRLRGVIVLPHVLPIAMVKRGLDVLQQVLTRGLLFLVPLLLDLLELPKRRNGRTNPLVHLGLAYAIVTQRLVELPIRKRTLLRVCGLPVLRPHLTHAATNTNDPSEITRLSVVLLDARLVDDVTRRQIEFDGVPNEKKDFGRRKFELWRENVDLDVFDTADFKFLLLEARFERKCQR